MVAEIWLGCAGQRSEVVWVRVAARVQEI